MELNEIKKIWDSHDQDLAHNLTFDEKQLRMDQLEKTKDQMDYPYISEWVELIGNGIIAIAVLLLSFAQIAEPKFFLLGLITIFITLIYIRTSYIKIRLLKQIEYYGMPLIKLQKKVAQVRKTILRFRKIEMWLFPLYLFPIILLVYKNVNNIDLFDRLDILVVKGIIYLSITYLFIYLINRHLYDKRFVRVEKLIERLKDFERE